MMKRILIVDDEPHVIRVLRVALEGAGYEIESAHHGESALAKIRQQAPDLMITEIQMPYMDGKALCRQITKEFPDRAFPILVVTSRPEQKHRVWAAEIQDLFFVEKPISTQQLIESLAQGFDRRDTDEA